MLGQGGRPSQLSVSVWSMVGRRLWSLQEGERWELSSIGSRQSRLEERRQAVSQVTTTIRLAGLGSVGLASYAS